MRIFHNPKDRKGLENNEQEIFETVVISPKNERMESEPTRSEIAEEEQALSKTENKEDSKKAGKKKIDSVVL